MQLQLIQQKIYEIRDQKVMLDFDLAELYEVETKALNQRKTRYKKARKKGRELVLKSDPKVITT